MRRQSLTLVDVLQPARWIALRYAGLFFLMFCISLVAFSKASPERMQGLTTVVQDLTVPVLNLLSRPVDTAVNAAEGVRHYFAVHAENERLRQENLMLRKWYHSAVALDEENRSLRQLVNMRQHGGVNFITTRIVAENSGPFGRGALLFAGASDGLVKGMGVASHEGLVGRVMNTGNHSARVLLVTDINSRIPVISQQSRERSILAGNNTEKAGLIYTPEKSMLEVGELVLTSGDDGLLPPGVPVGRVEAINADGGVVVSPLVNWHQLEYVSVIRHEMAVPGTEQ